MQFGRTMPGRVVRWVGEAGWLRSVFATAALLLPAAAYAQLIPYSVTLSPETYQPLPLNGGSATTLTISGSTDEGWATVNLPFPVTFFDQVYTVAHASTNTYLSFTRDFNWWINDPVPDSFTPNAMIMPWWDDNICDSIKAQELGTAPAREFVIEWNCHCIGTSTNSQTQVWFTEGSSSFRVKYGTPPTSVDQGGASIGIENQNGNIGYVPKPCASFGTCSVADWPRDTVVNYGQGPDVTVTAVSGVPIAYSGVASHMEAEARNVGGEAALGFAMRFWVSRDRTLDAGDVEVGTTTTTADALPNQTALFTLDAPIPTNLPPGQYFLLAQVDPLDVVDEDNENNNVGAYGPFDIGLPAPDLIVEAFDGPTSGKAGEPLSFAWTVRNIGNLRGAEVPYQLVLSNNPVVTPSDRTIFSGVLSVDALSSLEIQATALLPDDVLPGQYWLGISIDPEQQVFELDDTNNEGESGNELIVDVQGVRIDTDTLPPAEIASTYCVQLQASGGDGRFAWSVAGGALPPGIVLEEERAGAPDGEPPLATLLCGRPELVGSYDFSLRVTSLAFSAAHDFRIDVLETGMPLVTATRMLPQAAFGQVYEAQLEAVGGTAPYAWKLAGGELPPGVVLERSGLLHGTPQLDGRFDFTAEVEDTEATKARVDLSLFVSSPVRLTCVTRGLPAGRTGDDFSLQLLAAGGARPYRWAAVESRRLASGVTDDGANLGDTPPGFRLAEDGTVTARPTVAGKYLWQVKVTGADGASTDCPLTFEVVYAQGITITTTALPAAIVDTPYEARLQAAGATGAVRWSVGDGSSLPDGIELSADGTIAGTIPSFALEGARTRAFSFVVQATDEANRPVVASLTIDVRAEAAPAPPSGTGGKPKEKDGGCSAGGGVPGVLGAGLVLALLRRRR